MLHVQRAKVARILQYGGFVVIIALLVTVSVMLMEISQLRGESIASQNAAGSRLLSLMNYMYGFMVIGFALIIGGGFFGDQTMKGCIGKTFKVENVRGANSATVLFEGIRIRVVSSDFLTPSDYVTITGRSTVQGGRGRAIVYVGKKVANGDPGYLSGVSGEEV